MCPTWSVHERLESGNVITRMEEVFYMQEVRGHDKNYMQLFVMHYSLHHYVFHVYVITGHGNIFSVRKRDGVYLLESHCSSHM